MLQKVNIFETNCNILQIMQNTSQACTLQCSIHIRQTTNISHIHTLVFIKLSIIESIVLIIKTPHDLYLHQIYIHSSTVFILFYYFSIL